MKKIFYNILESEYTFETNNLIFYFSSTLYLEKFMERYFDNRIEMCYRLSSRYNIAFDCDDYFDTILYSSIEKRGFRIYDKKSEVFFKCLNKVKLDGRMKIN